jgi:hypothetical protein
MSAQQDDFEDLRRLLALKRHERPPPGYFQDFSGQVIARIHAGEAATSQSWAQRVLERAPWLQNLWDGFGARPIVAGAFGVSVCSLLVVGLISSERVDSNGAGLALDSNTTPALLATMPRQTALGTSLYERSREDHSYTGAVFRAQQPSIFEELRAPHVERMSFSPAGN